MIRAEQTQPFWKKWGFREETKVESQRSWKVWIYPDGQISTILPPIDLNSLFTYVVPRLYELGYYYELFQWNNGQHKAIINKRASGWSVTVSDATSTDPATAFFLALKRSKWVKLSGH